MCPPNYQSFDAPAQLFESENLTPAHMSNLALPASEQGSMSNITCEGKLV